MRSIVSVTTSSVSGYAQQMDAGEHALRADEPVSAGGSNSGPRPTELVIAGLAACTSITLRMYAERKGWNLGAIEVSVVLREEEGAAPRIDRRIAFGAALDPEQRSRLAEISEKTPVTKLLKSGVAIQTTVD